MSEERRRSQQERTSDGSANRPAYLKWIGVVLLLVSAYGAGWYYRNHRHDRFAKCLAAHQVRMYGLYWCPHCADQKAEFGASFKYVPYVECAIKGPAEMAPECKVAGVTHFPAWQFGADPPQPGVLSLQALSAKTGCSLP
jgi:hypothetical protein